MFYQKIIDIATKTELELWQEVREAVFEEFVSCPYCNSQEVTYRKMNYEGKISYQCRNCKTTTTRKTFNDLSRTVFEKLRLPIKKLLLAVSFYIYTYGLTDYNFVSRQLAISSNTFRELLEIFEKIFVIEDTHGDGYSRYPIERKIIIKRSAIFNDPRKEDLIETMTFYNEIPGKPIKDTRLSIKDFKEIIEKENQKLQDMDEE